MDPIPPLRIAVVGTDTDVGKTHVTSLLTRGLRSLSRKVWLHKPVACGDWQAGTAGDVRALAPLVGDGQDPTSLCRRQWPEPCSPHLAARLAGDRVTMTDLHQDLAPLSAGGHDLLVEGAGGVLSPLADDGGIIDLAREHRLAALIVTRPHLGTLNHTRLTVAELRRAGIPLLGLVINWHEAISPSAAVDHAAAELAELCALPILAELAFVPQAQAGQSGKDLAEAVLATPCARRGQSAED